MSSAIEVLIEVSPGKSKSAKLEPNQLEALRSEHLAKVMQSALPSSQVASVLSLPVNTPVRLSVVVNKEETADTGKVSVTASVHSVPSVLEGLKGRLEDEVGTMLFANIDRKDVPMNVAEALGYGPTEKVQFAVKFPVTAPKAISPQTLTAMTDCGPGTQYSWGKGCNSWPS